MNNFVTFFHAWWFHLTGSSARLYYRYHVKLKNIENNSQFHKTHRLILNWLSGVGGIVFPLSQSNMTAVHKPDPFEVTIAPTFLVLLSIRLIGAIWWFFPFQSLRRQQGKLSRVQLIWFYYVNEIILQETLKLITSSDTWDSLEIEWIIICSSKIEMERKEGIDSNLRS